MFLQTKGLGAFILLGMVQSLHPRNRGRGEVLRESSDAGRPDSLLTTYPSAAAMMQDLLAAPAPGRARGATALRGAGPPKEASELFILKMILE